MGTPIHPSVATARGLTDDQRQQLDRLADLLRDHSADRLDAFLDCLADGHEIKRTVHIAGKRPRTEQV